MKLGKKSMTALSFTIGACIFVSTAFADTLLGSGYDRFKGSVKHTTAQMEKGLNNFTVEALFTLKDNGQTLLQSSTTNKIDTVNKASEESYVTQQPNGETRSRYTYTDKKTSIYKNGIDNKYYVTEMPKDTVRGESFLFSNPLNDKGAPEIEKIVDAVVGNLKDYVQVEEKPDGGKAYSGTLTEAQVPALVNAVSSFGMKQMIGDQGRVDKESRLPQLEKDIFVKKVTGAAVENKAGLLENVTGHVTMSGKDKNGNQHDLALDVVVKLTNIGSTKVAKPDLTGANVENVARMGGLSSKHVGKYKNDIVIEKNGKFVKIGERTLEITTAENDKVAGKFTETVKPGFEAEYPDKYNFTFEYNPDDSNSRAMFKYKNAKGVEEQGQLHPDSNNGKIYLNLNMEIVSKDSYRINSGAYFNDTFTRIFED